MNDLTLNGNLSGKPDCLYLEVNRLETKGLNKLCSGEILALCVKDFYPPNLIQEFNDRVLNHSIKGGYGVDQQIIHTGIAFYDTVANSDSRYEYLNSGMDRMRDEFTRFS